MELPPPETGDAFRMLIDGGQVVIEFGRIARTPAPGGGTAVTVTDRMVLPVDTARRLLHTIGYALRPHEARLRAEQARALSPGEAGLAARPAPPAASRPAVDRSGDQAAKLLQLVADWGAPRQFERSFRMTAGALQANRFLLTLNAADIPGTPQDSALAICSAMGMPLAQRRAAEAVFGQAKAVHFGFEGDADRAICKLYLEHPVSALEAKLAHATGEPVLLHLAFKWGIAGGAAVTTRYLWHPLLTAGEIDMRLQGLYGGTTSEAYAIAKELLALAVQNAAAETLQYLEVEELENERRSFDLNVYNAGLAVRDVQGPLQRMRTLFELRPSQFQALYDQIKGLALGHLAGGVHRDGQPFFNLYYGVANLPTFNRAL